jgi:hypothetical protein
MAGREPREVLESFDIGEKVWLDSRNLRLRTNLPKLTDRQLGPFKILEKLSDRAYRLDLPENLKIHNMFYVGLLSKVKEDDSRPILKEPGPLEVEGEEEYEVEEITDSERCPEGWYYRVKWRGYGPESNTWEPFRRLYAPVFDNVTLALILAKLPFLVSAKTPEFLLSITSLYCAVASILPLYCSPHIPSVLRFYGLIYVSYDVFSLSHHIVVLTCR